MLSVPLFLAAAYQHSEPDVLHRASSQSVEGDVAFFTVSHLSPLSLAYIPGRPEVQCTLWEYAVWLFASFACISVQDAKTRLYGAVLLAVREDVVFFHSLLNTG